MPWIHSHNNLNPDRKHEQDSFFNKEWKATEAGHRQDASKTRPQIAISAIAEE